MNLPFASSFVPADILDSGSLYPICPLLGPPAVCPTVCFSDCDLFLLRYVLKNRAATIVSNTNPPNPAQIRQDSCSLPHVLYRPAGPCPGQHFFRRISRNHPDACHPGFFSSPYT